MFLLHFISILYLKKHYIITKIMSDSDTYSDTIIDDNEEEFTIK